MTVARALVVCAPPLAFVCLLPLLRLVVGADGTPYAGVDSDFVSLSALVGRAPAAGTFGLLVGALLGTLGVRDDLTRTWAQRAALALTYVTGLLFFSTPLQFSPAAHKASTAALMVALTAVLAAQTHAFPHPRLAGSSLRRSGRAPRHARAAGQRRVRRRRVGLLCGGGAILR